MPFPAHVVRVLIASPGDVQAERTALREAIWAWNDEHAVSTGVVLLPVGWDTHSRPELGGHPQQLIDRQVVNAADVLIGVFWTRLGTPTPDSASGTVHEIETAHAAGKPVMLFFSDAPAVMTNADLDQVQAVRDFRELMRQRGLIGSYDDVGGLVRLARRALLDLVREKFNLPTAEPASPVARGGPRVVAQVEHERRDKGIDSKGRIKQSSYWHLVVTNTGDSSARRVTVELADGQTEPRIHGIEDEISDLPVGAQVRFSILLTMGSPTAAPLALTWTDDAGREYSERQTIRF